MDKARVISAKFISPAVRWFRLQSVNGKTGEGFKAGQWYVYMYILVFPFTLSVGYTSVINSHMSIYLCSLTQIINGKYFTSGFCIRITIPYDLAWEYPYYFCFYNDGVYNI